MRWALFTNVRNFLPHSFLVTNSTTPGQIVLLQTFSSFWCMRQKMSFSKTCHFFRLRCVRLCNFKHQAWYDVFLESQEPCSGMGFFIQNECVDHCDLQQMHCKFLIPFDGLPCSIIWSYQLVNFVDSTHKSIVVTDGHRAVNKNFMTTTNSLSGCFFCVHIAEHENITFVLELYTQQVVFSKTNRSTLVKPVILRLSRNAVSTHSSTTTSHVCIKITTQVDRSVVVVCVQLITIVQKRFHQVNNNCFCLRQMFGIIWYITIYRLHGIVFSGVNTKTVRVSSVFTFHIDKRVSYQISPASAECIV